ncbi:aldo/keto reductase [Shewanella gaetbuli]
MALLPIQQHFPNASPLVYGCMGLGGGWDTNPIQNTHIKQAHEVIDCALENNIHYFDHADIYTRGKAEQVFGQVLKQRPQLREQMIIQTKCGIRFADENTTQRYDLSSQWITHSVEKSLKQLNTEYLDILLLHRPDPLMQVDEIAEALAELQSAGKVTHFGVSNMHQYQMAKLQKVLDTPLVVNQIEVSLAKQAWIDEGVYAGNQAGKNINFTSGTLEYCQDNGVQVQSWGSLCQGVYSGNHSDTDSQAVQETTQLVNKLAAKYQTSVEAILLAWITRHPAQVQPVIGTTNLQRIAACAKASVVTLSREDWYALYITAKGHALP